MANFFDPHHPFGAPEPFRALYDADRLPLPSGRLEELAAKPAVQREYHAKSYDGHAPGFAEYSEAELREARAGYYAMVSMIDAEVGRIHKALEVTGQARDTLVVFTSDHGEMLGDHAIILKRPMLYDLLVRVPLILSWPGRIADLTATLLDVAGAAETLEGQGRRLMKLALGGAAGPEGIYAKVDTSGWAERTLEAMRQAGLIAANYTVS